MPVDEILTLLPSAVQKKEEALREVMQNTLSEGALARLASSLRIMKTLNEEIAELTNISTNYALVNFPRGFLGYVDLCQVGVYLGIQVGNLRLILDYRLYLPQAMINDPSNIEKFGISVEKFIFKKKQELALEMVDSLISEGIKINKIVMDDFFGADSVFLSQLSERNIIFLADIACDMRLFLKNQLSIFLNEREREGENLQY